MMDLIDRKEAIKAIENSINEIDEDFMQNWIGKALVLVGIALSKHAVKNEVRSIIKYDEDVITFESHRKEKNNE